jgi:hypothetical protein
VTAKAQLVVVPPVRKNPVGGKRTDKRAIFTRNGAIIKAFIGSGCCMKPRYVPALLSVLLFCVPVVSASDQKTPPPHISKQTRMDLVRAFNAELVYIRSPFPMGKTGLMLKEGKLSPDGDELQRMIAMWGPAAKPGDQARISEILVKNDRIHFEINGGPVRKQKWYQHIQFGGSGGMTSVAPSDPNANPRGSYVDLVFNGYVPELDPKQLKDLLRPVFDFNAKSAVEAYLDTLPPKIRDAIKNHRVLVGMNREMVMAAKGRPPKKVREKDGDMDYEEWIYGEPPQDVDFVRLTGDEVVRLETMKVNGEKVVRSEKEVNLEQPTVAKGSGEPQVRPANAPSLRRPGEEADPTSPAGAPAGGRAPAPLPPPDPLGQDGPAAPPN